MGSWLFHLAFILFGDRVGIAKWNEEDMGSYMMLPMFYSWHLILNSCFMASIHVITWFYYKVNFYQVEKLTANEHRYVYR